MSRRTTATAGSLSEAAQNRTSWCRCASRKDVRSVCSSCGPASRTVRTSVTPGPCESGEGGCRQRQAESPMDTRWASVAVSTKAVAATSADIPGSQVAWLVADEPGPLIRLARRACDSRQIRRNRRWNSGAARPRWPRPADGNCAHAHGTTGRRTCRPPARRRSMHRPWR